MKLQHYTTFLMAIYTIQSIKCNEDQSIIRVQRSGVVPLTPKDVAVAMYLDLQNVKEKSVSASVTAHQCCLSFKDNVDDCKVMQLFGGFVGELKALQHKRVSFAYPTVYPYDLEGECEIHIKTDENNNLLSHIIPFNTALHPDILISWMPHFLQEFLFGVSIYKCSAQDQDSLHRCMPVNCVLKYRGRRNYYNQNTGQCERVPVCKHKIEIYDPVNNLCKKKSPSLEPVTLSTLYDEQSNDAEQDFQMTMKVVCEHGELSADKQKCTCHQGWGSLDLSSEELDPADPVYRLCNIPIGVKKRPSIMVIILLCTGCIFVLLVFGCIGAYIRAKTMFVPAYNERSTADRKKVHLLGRFSDFIISSKSRNVDKKVDVGNVKMALLSPFDTVTAPLNVGK